MRKTAASARVSSPTFSFNIHETSGERFALFGSVNIVEESKQIPAASFSAHSSTLRVRRLFLQPDSILVGGITINSPFAESSNLRSGWLWQSSSNCSSVSLAEWKSKLND